eukprot:11657986-Alexandrium_andersonii.AAC.1
MGQHEQTDGLMFNADGAEQAFKDRDFQITDATKKGVETMLMNYRRGFLSTSEAANTLLVDGFSDASAGLHFVSKAWLC